MLSTREISALMKSVATVVKEHVGAAVRGMSERVDALEGQIKAIPAGEKGEPGERGPAGERGDKGDPGEKGMDGAHGERGEQGPAGECGRDGRDGADGKDGVDGKSLSVDDIKPLVESMQASWALDFERRAQDVLQRAIDRMPVPKDGRDGIDGKDGFGLEDFEAEYDGEGGLTLRFVRGDLRKECALRLPLFVDRGVFKEGEPYQAGNAVTFGGQLYLAQKDAPAGKPGESPDWRLAVKKGRDGRDGEKGDRGEKGEAGRSWVKTDDLNQR